MKHQVQSLAHSRHLINGGYQYFFQVEINSKNLGLCYLDTTASVESYLARIQIHRCGLEV